jgi:hypothetical protein
MNSLKYYAFVQRYHILTTAALYGSQSVPHLQTDYKHSRIEQLQQESF